MKLKIKRTSKRQSAHRHPLRRSSSLDSICLEATPKEPLESKYTRKSSLFSLETLPSSFTSKKKKKRDSKEEEKDGEVYLTPCVLDQICRNMFVAKTGFRKGRPKKYVNMEAFDAIRLCGAIQHTFITAIGSWDIARFGNRSPRSNNGILFTYPLEFSEECKHTLLTQEEFPSLRVALVYKYTYEWIEEDDACEFVVDILDWDRKLKPSSRFLKHLIIELPLDGNTQCCRKHAPI